MAPKKPGTSNDLLVRDCWPCGAFCQTSLAYFVNNMVLNTLIHIERGHTLVPPHQEHLHRLGMILLSR
jgi:hypothetical protein